MEFYKVLLSNCEKNGYKGIFRSEPIPGETTTDEYNALWGRYSSYYEDLVAPGIVSELSIEELKLFVEASCEVTLQKYELVYFSDTPCSLYSADFYGIDVATRGGYSMLAEGLFLEKSRLTHVINSYFLQRVNENKLFDKVEDALCLRELFFELNAMCPNFVEYEDWLILYVYRVK